MKRTSILCLSLLLLSQTVWLGSETNAKQRKIEVEGTIDVLQEDPEDGIGRTVFYLNTGTERLELDLKPGVLLEQGSRMRMRGCLRNGKLNVERSEVVETVQLTSTSHALGEQRQLVMLFNFQDQPNNKPWTADYIRNLLLNDVNQYWQQVSYGQTWFTGDFTGWFTLPINSTDCSANVTQAALDRARTLGLNPDTYTHFILIHPSTSCSPSGASTATPIDSAGNFTSYVYISGTADFYHLAHECGHSLGLFHSNSLNCGSVTFGNSCTLVAYGDHYDVMGYYNTGALNASQRDLLGWLGPRIQSVTSDGTFTLTPLGIADANPKALRIQQSSTTNSTSYYYIEYRQPVGYDSFLSSYPGVTNGVLLHLGTITTDLNQLVSGSRLLDSTPTVTGANEALAVGSSYYDPAIPVTVTVLSANSSGATVSVNFGAATCTPSNPTVAISPSSGPVCPPGTAVPYTVTVSNNDSSACAPASLNLQSTVPSGWTAYFTNPTLTVNPGTSASTTLTITSPPSAAAGSYNVGVTATSSSSGASGSASSSYCVATSLGISVSTDRPSYTRRQWVTMMAMVSANGSPVQGVGVNFTMTKSNGTTVTQSATTGTNGSASARFQTKRNDPVGTYQGRGVANSNGASGSGATTFTVQ